MGQRDSGGQKVSLLADILAQKQSELPALRSRKLPAPPALRPLSLKRSAPAAEAEQAPDALRLICEIKQKSPSAGTLSRRLSISERASCYEACGAAMISVLCDQRFFDGSFEHLSEAYAATQIPLLAKEFVIDEVQLDAARAYGASAVLLIVRCLGSERLTHLVNEASARGLVPLVEIFTEEEAKMALDAGATHIGVNARDLDTLKMDAEGAARVLASLPTEVVRCQFSGVKSVEGIAACRELGSDAALIGEVLMRQDDPGPLLRSFVQAAQGQLS